MADWFRRHVVQDIHYQGLTLKETPAPLGFH
jgi:hypothetical protein